MGLRVSGSSLLARGERGFYFTCRIKASKQNDLDLSSSKGSPAYAQSFRNTGRQPATQNFFVAAVCRNIRILRNVRGEEVKGPHSPWWGEYLYWRGTLLRVASVVRVRFCLRYVQTQSTLRSHSLSLEGKQSVFL